MTTTTVVDLVSIEVDNGGCVTLHLRDSDGHHHTKRYTADQFGAWSELVASHNVGMRVVGFTRMGMRRIDGSDQQLMALTPDLDGYMGNPTASNPHGVCQDLMFLLHSRNQRGRQLREAVRNGTAFTLTNQIRQRTT